MWRLTFAGIMGCLLAAIAQGATLQVRLLAGPANGGGADGLWNIVVQAKTDTPEGIKGMQFDIRSNGDNRIVPVAGVPSSKAKITWAISGFSLINPSRIDATPGLGYPDDTDTDL